MSGRSATRRIGNDCTRPSSPSWRKSGDVRASEKPINGNCAPQRSALGCQLTATSKPLCFGMRPRRSLRSCRSALPETFQNFLSTPPPSLGLEIVEVHGDHDLKSLLERIPPTREPALARVRMELDDKTDAVVLQRQNPEPWERRYLAVINCRSWHAHRRYFSKWHELVHLLLEGRQLRLEFRRTGVERKHPEEILVDKIAGELAFFPPVFVPILLEEIHKTGADVRRDR